MFRKVTQRLTAALSGGDSNIQALRSMGFDAEQSRNALEAADGNLERATELLLSSAPQPQPRPQPPAVVHPTQRNRPSEDEELQRALQESLAVENERKRREEKQRKNLQQKKAATPAPNTMNAPEPYSDIDDRTSRIPPRLQDKSKEEQITRCVSRVSGYPRAVDTLLVALTAIRNDPPDRKYRTVDKTTAGYKDTLMNTPGAEDLLLAVNFRREGSLLQLDRNRVDMALLWIAVSSLENARSTQPYIRAKKQLDFQKHMQRILTASSSAETASRNGYLRQLSSEPDPGDTSALLHLHLTSDIIHRRRFHGDDQLIDVVHWIGTIASPLAEKIQSGEWCLVDRNLSPPAPIPCDAVGLNKTLQSAGCWPSARLEVRPCEMVDGAGGDMERTRGLGVAAISS